MFNSTKYPKSSHFALHVYVSNQRGIKDGVTRWHLELGRQKRVALGSRRRPNRRNGGSRVCAGRDPLIRWESVRDPWSTWRADTPSMFLTCKRNPRRGPSEKHHSRLMIRLIDDAAATPADISRGPRRLSRGPVTTWKQMSKCNWSFSYVEIKVARPKRGNCLS